MIKCSASLAFYNFSPTRLIHSIAHEQPCKILYILLISMLVQMYMYKGAQWLSGRVLDSRPRAAGSSLTVVTELCPLARHINPSLVLVQPRKTRPYITERLLMGRKESNQTNKHMYVLHVSKGSQES